MGTTAPARIVLAKVGLDGHDRGIKVVARGLRDEGIMLLAESPTAARLRDLDLCWNHMGRQGASALAGSPHLANLASLRLAEEVQFTNLHFEAPLSALDAADALALQARFGDCVHIT